MSAPPIGNVASGPSDPDPPPPPKALLDAIRANAIVMDEHLQIGGLDRWLMCDRVAGWQLADAPVEGHVRIDLFALNLLRRVEPVAGTPLVSLRGARYSVRPVLSAGYADVRLHVGLVVAPPSS